MVLLRLGRFVLRYRLRLLAAYACLLAQVGLGLAVPWLVKIAIDTGLSSGQIQLLVVLAVAVVMVTLLKGLFSYGQSYLGEAFSHQVGYDLRNAFYDRLQRLSFTYFDRAQTGQLMSRATADVDAVRMFLNVGLMQLVNLLVTVGGILIVALTVDWRLALVLVACLPILAWQALGAGRALKGMYQRVQEGLAHMTVVLQESLAGARVVKAFAREPHQIARFSQVNETLLADNLRATRRSALNLPSMLLTLSLVTAAVIWLGGREVVAGRMTVGELGAFTGYLVLLTRPVRFLGWLVSLVARAIPSTARIFEVLDAESEVRDRPGAGPLPAIAGHVRFEHVSFRYGAASPALHDLDLAVPAGQTVALLGSTGSGKTTLVNLLPRFYDVTGGRVTLDGIDLRAVTLDSLRRQIGLVLQDSFLFTASVRENIAYGLPQATPERIEAAARAANAHDFIAALPDGYDTIVGERGLTLSGGQRQRVAIARALLLDPRILILDDATSSVDAGTERQIQEALARLMVGRTSFVIAQRLSTVLRADLIVVIEQGRIVERGRHAELLAQNGVYRRLYDLQLRPEDQARRQAEMTETV